MKFFFRYGSVFWHTFLFLSFALFFMDLLYNRRKQIMEIQTTGLLSRKIPSIKTNPLGSWNVKKKNSVSAKIKVLIYEDFLLQANMNGKPTAVMNFDFDLMYEFSFDPCQVIFEKGEQKCTYQLQFPSALQKWRNILKKRINQKGFHKQFKSLQKIGKGNFAVVYLVRKFEDKKLYAVKAFSKQIIFSEDNGKQTLMKEIQIMRHLRHPNIMKLEEIFETQNSFYLVFQFLSGGQLYDYVKRKHNFQSHEIQQIVFGILKGLKQMHQKKIMHRDLKPENLLFREEQDFDCVIADFGLSEFSDASNYLFVRCGTPGYVAPQIINIKDMNTKYSPVCDIYSLGIIFYTLLYKKSPFIGKNQNDILRQNRDASISFSTKNFQISPQALDLLKKMLEKDPNKRITAAKAISHSYFNSMNEDLSEGQSIPDETQASICFLDKQNRKEEGGVDFSLRKGINKQRQLRQLSKDSCISFKLGKQTIFTGYRKQISCFQNENFETAAQKPKISSFNASRRYD